MSTQFGIETMKTEHGAAGRARLFPVALKLAGVRCLVVGGGSIALRKVHDLLACGAVVHAVSPEWCAELLELERLGEISTSTRRFAASDLAGVRVVVAATDDPEVQRHVAAEAEARAIPCNVVDVNHLCTFYVPAVLRRGDLTVAVTTDGKFPLLAVALRDRIAEALSDRAGEALDTLAVARQRAFEAFPNDAAARLDALRRLLTAEVADQIFEGRLEDFEAHFESWKAALPGATP